MYYRITAIEIVCIVSLLFGAPIPRCKGFFQVGTKTLTFSNEQTLRALQKQADKSGKLIRVMLLVDATFQETALKEIHCRNSSRIGPVLTTNCPEPLVPLLHSLPGVLHVKLPEHIGSSMDTTRKLVQIDQVHGARPGNLPDQFTGKDVLIGILENEFDPHHPAFLDSAGNTRFIALWDQNESLASNNDFGYGIIKNWNELKEDTLFGLSNAFHGTHTASVAAGSDRTNSFYGVAPDALIAGVKYSGSCDNCLVDGITWIFSLADSLQVPCVINLSIGLAAGPHDGSSLFDKAVDLLSGPGKIVVGAIGNDGVKASHALFSLARNESRSTWITPARFTASNRPVYQSAIDMWGEPNKTFSATVLVLDTTDFSYLQSSNSITASGTLRYQPDTIYFQNATGTTDTISIQLYADRVAAFDYKPHIRVYLQYTNPNLFGGITIHSGSTARSEINVHAWNISKAPLRSFAMQGFQDGDAMYNVNEIGGTSKRGICVGAYTGRTSLSICQSPFKPW